MFNINNSELKHYYYYWYDYATLGVLVGGALGPTPFLHIMLC